jgi:hypothetical protein
LPSQGVSQFCSFDFPFSQNIRKRVQIYLTGFMFF